MDSIVLDTTRRLLRQPCADGRVRSQRRVCAVNALGPAGSWTHALLHLGDLAGDVALRACGEILDEVLELLLDLLIHDRAKSAGQWRTTVNDRICHGHILLMVHRYKSLPAEP